MSLSRRQIKSTGKYFTAICSGISILYGQNLPISTDFNTVLPVIWIQLTTNWSCQTDPMQNIENSPVIAAATLLSSGLRHCSHRAVQRGTVWSLERGTSNDYQRTLSRIQCLPNITLTVSLYNTHTHAVLRPFFQVHPGEPVLSQRRDLLEQPLDFYEPDVLPATQPIMSNPVVW